MIVPHSPLPPGLGLSLATGPIHSDKLTVGMGSYHCLAKPGPTSGFGLELHPPGRELETRLSVDPCSPPATSLFKRPEMGSDAEVRTHLHQRTQVWFVGWFLFF